MNPNDKEFDRRMREKFKNFTPGVPVGLWNKIDDALDSETSKPGKIIGPTRTRWKFTPRWAAAVLVVFALAYWYNRPVEVIYLQGKVGIPVVVGEEPPSPRPVLQPADEPGDISPAKSVFTGKVLERINRISAEMPREGTVRDDDTQPSAVEIQLVATDAETAPDPIVDDPLETYIIEVLDLQPLVVLEEAEEVMLANVGPSDTFGVSRLLNFVVGAVDQRAEKAITFSNDEEGSLRIDFNFNLVKNRKSK